MKSAPSNPLSLRLVPLLLALMLPCLAGRAADSSGNELCDGWRAFATFGSTILRNTDAQGFLSQGLPGLQPPQETFSDTEQFGLGLQWQWKNGAAAQAGLDIGQPWQAQSTYPNAGGQSNDEQVNQQWFLTSFYLCPGYTWITDAQGTAFAGLRLEEGWLSGNSQVIDQVGGFNGTQTFGSAAFGFGPVLKVERLLSSFPGISWSLDLGYRFLEFQRVWVTSSSGSFAPGGPGASLADLGRGFQPDLTGFVFRIGLAWGPKPLTRLEPVETLSPSLAPALPPPPLLKRK